VTRAHTADASGAPARRERPGAPGLALAVALVGQFTAVPDATIVNVAVRAARRSTYRTSSSASTRPAPGSGLGLAIALENARLLGGNISVSSDVERGSVFRLTLPPGPAGDVSER